MVPAKKVATSGIPGKLPEAQRVYENGGDAAPTKIFEVNEIAREGIEASRKNATMSSRQTDLESRTGEGIGCLMHDEWTNLSR